MSVLYPTVELLSRDWKCMLGFTEGDQIVHNSYLKLEKRKVQSRFWRHPHLRLWEENQWRRQRGEGSRKLRELGKCGV